LFFNLISKQPSRAWRGREALQRAASHGARILLLAASGMQDRQVAAQLKIMPENAARWRNRYLDGGIAVLEKEAPRPGRTRTITPERIQEVIRMTTQEKRRNATHWSTRTMAATAGLSEKSVRRIWHKHGLKPHLVKTSKVSNDLQFSEKLEAIVGCISIRPGTPSFSLPTRRARSRLSTAPSPDCP